MTFNPYIVGCFTRIAISNVISRACNLSQITPVKRWKVRYVAKPLGVIDRFFGSRAWRWGKNRQAWFTTTSWEYGVITLSGFCVDFTAKLGHPTVKSMHKKVRTYVSYVPSSWSNASIFASGWSWTPKRSSLRRNYEKPLERDQVRRKVIGRI